MATTLAARHGTLSWFVDSALMKRALADSFRRLTPRYQWRNPVMFVVYIGSILTTILWLQALSGQGEAPAGFILAVTLAMGDALFITSPSDCRGSGKRRRRRRLKRAGYDRQNCARAGVPFRRPPSSQLRRGDIVYAEQGRSSRRRRG
jgi:K+-transporting ATPase ATPase B chain